jgi:hypothetical protein
MALAANKPLYPFPGVTMRPASGPLALLYLDLTIGKYYFMYRDLDSRPPHPLGWPYDYLHVETGSRAQGLDTLQVGKGIGHHISDAVRDVLREE